MARGSLPFMARRTGTVEGVASSSTFSAKFPIGSTYEQIDLVMANISHAQVTNIKVRINGGEVWSFRSGTELELINSYLDADYTSTAGTLRFMFGRLGVKNALAKMATVLGTGVPATAPGEVAASVVEITGDLASGLSSPTITPYAILREPQKLGILRQVRGFSYTPSGTGWVEISDLVRNRLIEYIGFNMTSGVFSEAVLEMDGTTVFEGPLALHNARANAGVRATQTNWFFMDFNPNGDDSGWLDAIGASDLRLRLNVTTAAAIPFVVGTLGQLGR